MIPRSILTSLLLAAGITLALPAHAALHDRGGGLLYDDVLDATWLQYVNFGAGSAYDDAYWGTAMDGAMSWQNAMDWAGQLSYYDNVRNQTLTGWRLPTVKPVNGTAFNYQFSADGSTDFGGNIGAPGTIYAGSTASELAHLYNTLVGSGSTFNGEPFLNFRPDYYWTATDFAPKSGYNAWAHWLGSNGGGQTDLLRTLDIGVIVLHDGDVAAVPEPSEYVLMLAGLGFLGFVARRRKQQLNA
jgi:hypothetical protein